MGGFEEDQKWGKPGCPSAYNLGETGYFNLGGGRPKEGLKIQIPSSGLSELESQKNLSSCLHYEYTFKLPKDALIDCSKRKIK
jgi:hypothetical protein